MTRRAPSRLVPTGLALRYIRRRLRSVLVLVLLIALPLTALFVLATVNRTSAFTAPEVAQIAMGNADLQVRAGSGDIAAKQAPEVGNAGISQVTEDLDVELDVQSGHGSATLTGRILPIRDNLTRGTTVPLQHTDAKPQIALSPTAMEKLGVGLGGDVELGLSGIPLTVTDEVEYANDTTNPIIIVDPAALDETSMETVRREAADVGSPRWLLTTDDVPAAVAYINDLGLVPSTRQSIPASSDKPLINPLLTTTALAAVLVALSAAAVTALSGAQSDQFRRLRSLGATTRQVRGVLLRETTIIALAAFLLSAGLGAALSPAAVALGQRLRAQVWGALSLDWGTLALGCVGAIVSAAICGIAVTHERRAHDRNRKRTGPGAARPQRRRVLPGHTGRALAGAHTRWVSIGTVAIALIVGVGATAISILSTVQHNYETDPLQALPANTIGLRLLATLSEEQQQHLAAATDSAITPVPSPLFDGSTEDDPLPAVIKTALTSCDAEGRDPSVCYANGAREPNIAVVDEKGASSILGRPLTPGEETSLLHGDGLSLTSDGESKGEMTVTTPGFLQADDPATAHSVTVHPVHVAGFDYFSLPGLLLSETQLDRLGLMQDADTSPDYLLTSQGAPPTPAAVRAALPDIASDDIGVVADETSSRVQTFRSITQTVAGVAAVACFAIVALLVLSWATQERSVLRGLRSLGATRWELTRLLMWRGIRAIGLGVVVGALLWLLLTTLFGRYVGMPMTLQAPLVLLAPIATLLALPTAAAARVLGGRD